MTAETTAENKLLFQTFEWHTPSSPPPPNETHSNHSHYSRLTDILPSLAQLGATILWLPPGCKANNPRGNGYDCYDLWDLGEFDQKWARSTKWGSREELADLMKKAAEHKVECIWDAVLNHKTAGDSQDETWAVEVDQEDRRYEITAPGKIQAWLRFDFPGRERDNMKYSQMKWRAEHFNGTDWDQRAQKHAIFKLIDDPATYPKPYKQPLPPRDPANSGNSRFAMLAGKLRRTSRTVSKPAPPPPRRPGKGWQEDVDETYGNYDYVMFSNIDYTHPDVRQDVLNWGEWMIGEVGVDGFRLDAVQHFSYSFARELIAKIRESSQQKRGKDAFIVGEVWTAESPRILKWLDAVRQASGEPIYAYDAPLLYNFSRISEDVRHGSKNADLRTITRDSLMHLRQESAVTLVTNHDTQIGQTCYTPVMASLKALWYAFILLRQEGLPCVFWGDLFGTHGPHAEPPACLVPDMANVKSSKRNILPDLMLCRRLFAYGDQKDYWNDSMSCIGWTRNGTRDRPGCAVVMSIAPAVKRAVKKMSIGKPGEVWVDALASVKDKIIIGDKGVGKFQCNGMNVSVFVRQDVNDVERFPVNFRTHIYGS